MSRWEVRKTPGGMHCVPVGDLREHEISAGCWCAPALITGTDEGYAHNSLLAELEAIANYLREQTSSRL